VGEDRPWQEEVRLISTTIRMQHCLQMCCPTWEREKPCVNSPECNGLPRVVQNHPLELRRNVRTVIYLIFIFKKSHVSLIHNLSGLRVEYMYVL
jgi:hypothetical protein